jgi:nucleoside-diphosphate-sugar epimerase
VIVPALVRYFKTPGARWPGRTDPCADPIYVTDVADGAIAASLTPQAAGQAYNVAPPRCIRLHEFLGALCRALTLNMPAKSAPYIWASAAARASECWAILTRRQTAPAYSRAGLAILTEDVRHSPSKAQRELGWQPTVDIQEGIRRTAEWLREIYPDLVGHKDTEHTNL